MRRALLRKNASGGGFAFGNCLDFDGPNDYLSFAQYGSTTNTLAVSCWINGDDINTINWPIISDSSTNNYIRVNAINNRVVVRINSTNYFFTGFSFSNSTWYHLVMSSNAGSCRVYLNGIESTAGALSIPASSPSTNNFARLGFDNGGNYANGKFDEWGLWYGSYLTPTDVATLYNGGAGADVSTVNIGTLWVGSHLDESGLPSTTANLGSGGTINLNNFTGTPFVAH